MYCKYCGAKMMDGEKICPKCERKNGSNAAMIVFAAIAGVLLVAILAVVVLLGTGMLDKDNASKNTEPTVDLGTIPPDGNPDDETCKGTYTGTDEQASAQKDQVIATVGEYQLTNGQFQLYYWTAAQQLVQYGAYYGVDFKKPLDRQIQDEKTGTTWQQYFVAKALELWHSTMVLKAEAEKEDYQLPQEYLDVLETLDEEMEASVKEDGYASIEDMLQKNFGVNVTYAMYKDFIVDGWIASTYEEKLVGSMETTEEEIEKYYTNNAATLESYLGITKESGDLVSVRHILYMPDGATSATIRTEKFSDEAWASAETKAKDILKQWKKGEATEESFGALAKEHSMDGSASAGGLIEGVAEGDMVKAFNDWCFDESRKKGDNGVIKTEYGYHVMYFVSIEAEWHLYCRQGVQQEKASKWEEEKNAASPATFDYSKILLASFDFATS